MDFISFGFAVPFWEIKQDNKLPLWCVTTFSALWSLPTGMLRVILGPMETDL